MHGHCHGFCPSYCIFLFSFSGTSTASNFTLLPHLLPDRSQKNWSVFQVSEDALQNKWKAPHGLVNDLTDTGDGWFFSLCMRMELSNNRRLIPSHGNNICFNYLEFVVSALWGSVNLKCDRMYIVLPNDSVAFRKGSSEIPWWVSVFPLLEGDHFWLENDNWFCDRVFCTCGLTFIVESSAPCLKRTFNMDSYPKENNRPDAWASWDNDFEILAVVTTGESYGWDNVLFHTNVFMHGSLFPLLLSLSCAVLILGSDCVAENSFILVFWKLIVSPFGGMLSSLMLGLGMLQRMWWMDTWSCSFNSWGLTNCNHCDMGIVDQIYHVLFAGVLCWCSSQYCVWRCDQELLGWGKKNLTECLVLHFGGTLS